MFQVDDRTLRYAKAHFSDEFRRELEQVSRAHGVTEEEVMRERLAANLTGAPVRYSLTPRERIQLAVDNTQ